MVYDLVKRDSKLSNLYIYKPDLAKTKDLSLVHTQEFLDDFFSLKITEKTQYSELPLTKQIVHSFVLAVGGTILSMELTQKYKFIYHIGGGFHHSMPDRAEGFCYLNDAAIASKLYQKEHPGKKFLLSIWIFIKEMEIHLYFKMTRTCLRFLCIRKIYIQRKKSLI
ncbi:histone deacetylase domain protein [Leptospira interrogans serovar Bataviae str. HAI135]|nr:histone deacetylase domain protein [Leptospira interrogans serovar Bataviae str. HAI135]